jgi:hypothetical protein
MSGQGMPVRNKEKAVILMLHFYPVFQYPVIMTEVQPASRPHTGKHAIIRGNNRIQGISFT